MGKSQSTLTLVREIVLVPTFVGIQTRSASRRQMDLQISSDNTSAGIQEGLFVRLLQEIDVCSRIRLEWYCCRSFDSDQKVQQSAHVYIHMLCSQLVNMILLQMQSGDPTVDAKNTFDFVNSIMRHGNHFKPFHLNNQK